MISLSYHYHNSRRREREALERKLSTREGRRWAADVNQQQEDYSSGGSGGGQKSFSSSPRRAHTLKKQTSEINVVKKTSVPSSSAYDKSTASRPKRGLFSKLSVKKTKSFDNNNARTSSKSVEDLSGLVTVRETSSSVKPSEKKADESSDFSHLPSSGTKLAGVGEARRFCEALETLGPATLATVDVPLLKNVCLAKPEVDSDYDEANCSK